MQTFSTDLPKIEEFVQLNGRDVLEVGCGDGRLSALLGNKVGSLTAIDPDKEMINLARKGIDGADFQIGSGENLDFADRSFERFGVHRVKLPCSIKSDPLQKVYLEDYRCKKTPNCPIMAYP